MTEHNLFYYPYASITNAQLPLLKVAAVWFDKLAQLDPVGASRDSIGADHVAYNVVKLLKDASILEIVTASRGAGGIRCASYAPSACHGRLGAVSATVLLGAEWLLDSCDEKCAQENGLHYLLRT